MANYRRTATGNWSTLAQWQDDSTGSYQNSTVLPGAADVVYANNFTVTLDVDVVVLELRTTSALNVNAGGFFDFGAGNSVTANVFAGTSTCLRNYTTNLKFVVGNITGGTNNNAHAVINNTSGNLTITGNVVAGSGNEANGLRNHLSGQCTINGNVSGGNGGSASGAWNESGGIIVINGSSTGGNNSTAAGARNRASGQIIVNGIAIGGASSQCVGVLNESSGTVRVTTAQSSVNNPAVEGTNIAGTTIVANIVWANNGRVPVVGFVKFDNTVPKTAIAYQENGSAVTLVDNSVPNYPLEADVEQGVQYGPANIYTGTLVASITPQDIFTAIASSSDPIAVRLRNVSTVATTAATVASFDV